MDKTTLNSIIENNKKWIKGEGGEKADLRGANLSEANLSGVNLSGAYLSGADLSGADLSEANLSKAYLREAYLGGADLRGANLSGADLRGANLSGANLREAYLGGADLREANLSGANLRGAKNTEGAIARTTITPEGDLIAWKKCRDGVIVKLTIPKEAKRSNATGRKCRAEFVKVIEVIGAEIGVSQHDKNTIYQTGQIVRCDIWNENRWEECAGGIHFFITRQEAEEY